MDTAQFDKALVGAVFLRAGLVGWRDTTLVDAARDAELDLGRVRIRFPDKLAVLARFGTMTDAAVLAALPAGGTPRDKLFDLLMARFDQMQVHRAGIQSLMEAVPRDPAAALLLYGGTMRSMRWMLDAAGVPSGGLTGTLRLHGLAAVWAYAMRAWQKDEGADLAATMAALDRALDRAVQAEESLPGARGARAEVSGPPIVPGTAVAAADDGASVL